MNNENRPINGWYWNIENEYLNSISNIADEYNVQAKKTSDIQARIKMIQGEKERTLDNSNLERAYYEDRGPEFMTSFETYKKTIADAQAQKIKELDAEIAQLNAEYLANTYYLIKVKDNTRIKINQKKTNLEFELRMKQLDLERLYAEDLKFRRDNPGSYGLENYRERVDRLQLEIRQIKDALGRLDELYAAMELTPEERALAMSGLTGKAKDIYDGMIRPTEELSPLGPEGPEEDEPEGPEEDEPEGPEEDEPEGPEEDEPEGPEEDEPEGPEEDEPEGPEEDEPEGPEEDEPEDPTKDEEPSKIVKVARWIKKHKKKILIALGLTALAIALVVLVTQWLPALLAAQQASATAGLLGQMGSNSAMWFTATAGEQAALHGANTALASNISALTGMATTFTEATGAWTIGGQSLAVATQTATAAAAKAASAASALKLGGLLTGLGGLGTLGAGLLLGNGKDKTKASEPSVYKEICKKIRDLKERIEELSDEEFEEIFEEIAEQIINSEGLNVVQVKLLQRKLNKVKQKREKLKDEPIVEGPVEEGPVEEGPIEEEPVVEEGPIEDGGSPWPEDEEPEEERSINL